MVWIYFPSNRQIWVRSMFKWVQRKIIFRLRHSFFFSNTRSKQNQVQFNRPKQHYKFLFTIIHSITTQLNDKHVHVVHSSSSNSPLWCSLTEDQPAQCCGRQLLQCQMHPCSHGDVHPPRGKEHFKIKINFSDNFLEVRRRRTRTKRLV